MDTKTRAILNAREWLGTPWAHNKRDKGRGVDCIGFLFEVAKSVGIYLEPYPDKYEKIPIKNEIEKYLEHNLTRCRDNRIEIARVILYEFRGYKTHVAIATSDHSIIHACNLGRHHSVIEHNIDGIWQNCINSVWIPKEWAFIHGMDILGDK